MTESAPPKRTPPPNRPSYHDAIQALARVVERDRRAVYRSGAVRSLTNREWQYLHGALYKVERLAYFPAPLDKTLDDIVDAYNYLALLFEALSTRLSQGGSA